MDFDRFISQIKQIRSVPTGFLLDRLTAALHSADAGVHSTFFAGQAPATYLSHNAAADQPALAELSVRYASYALEAVPNWGFGQTIGTDAWPGIQNWFTTSSTTIGLDMMTDYLAQDSVVGDAFADPAGSASAIADRIADDDFLTGLVAECSTFGSDLPVKLTLLVLRILDNGGANFQRVAAVWSAHDEWHPHVEGYDHIGWLDALPPDLVRGGPTYNDTYQTVATCCAAQTQYHYTNTTVMGNGAIVHYDALRTTYGLAVGQWLDSGAGPKAYGLRSGSQLNNVVNQPWGQGGCVIAGTPVLLADGTSKPVEAIVEGDRVVSGAGAVSVASAELVVNDRLTQLYSFNDDVPFMSLEHAVMTQRGWCSLAPSITLDFAPHQKVSQLRVGDVVWRECGRSESGNGVRYEHVLVKRINVQDYAPGTAPVGYDLHLRGQASYHAHGYCTLSNYPEITSQRVAANVLSRMSPAEQLRLEDTLVRLAPELSKALGAGVVTQVASVFDDLHSAAARAAHTGTNGRHLRTDIGAAHLVVPRLQVVPRIGSAVAADLKEVGITHGTLCVGGEAVESMTDGHRVYWSRPVAGGRENGVLEFAPHGLRARGAVSYGGAVQLFTAVGMVGYTVTAAPNAAAWYEFDMGFTRDDQGNLHATGSISDPAHPEGAADLARYSTVVFSTSTSSGHEVLHATVAIDPQFCQFGGSTWVGAEIDFTPDYTQFAGTAYPFDAGQPGYRGAAVALTGTCKDLARLAQMAESATRMMTARPTALDHLAAAPATVAAAHPLVLAAASMLDADTPTVEHLFDLPTPDMTNVQRLAFAKMQSLMLLALSNEQPDWLKFLGQTAPPVGAGQTLSSADAALVSDSATAKFLVDRFAVGYLTQAFRTSDDAAIKAVFAGLPAVDDKLAFFWKGTGTTSFAKDPAYSVLSAKMLDSAYTDAATDLQPYLAGDRVSWAQQLYDYCVKEPTLTGLALTNTMDGRQQLTHLATLLHVLDPVARIQKDGGKAISYATSLYERVMDVRLNDVLKFVSVADKDDMVEYLTEFFKQYFASLLTSQWSDEIRAQAAKDLADLMAQYNVDNANALVEGQPGRVGPVAVGPQQVHQLLHGPHAGTGVAHRNPPASANRPRRSQARGLLLYRAMANPRPSRFLVKLRTCSLAEWPQTTDNRLRTYCRGRAANRLVVSDRVVLQRGRAAALCRCRRRRALHRGQPVEGIAQLLLEAAQGPAAAEQAREIVEEREVLEA